LKEVLPGTIIKKREDECNTKKISVTDAFGRTKRISMPGAIAAPIA
jgi:hypothetical protein